MTNKDKVLHCYCMTILKDKKRVALTLPIEKYKELKIKAIKAGLSLSDLMSISASEYSITSTIPSKKID